MNRFKLLSILVVLGLCLGSITSCTDDDTITPQNDRDKFIGTWDVNETCQRNAYSVQIEADPSNSVQVLINNFWLIGYQEEPPYAIVAGNSIVIPKQYIGNNKEIEVTGSGSYSNDIITWSYTVNDGADLYTCSATYEKP